MILKKKLKHNLSFLNLTKIKVQFIIKNKPFVIVLNTSVKVKKNNNKILIAGNGGSTFEDLRIMSNITKFYLIYNL